MPPTPELAVPSPTPAREAAPATETGSPGASAGLLSGLLLAVVVAFTARGIHGLLPEGIGAVLGEVVLAVLLGLMVANLLLVQRPALGARVKPGVGFAFKTVLRVAIVLLGARLSFQQVLAIGGEAVVMIAALMTLALVLAHGVGRWAGVSPKLASLIGVGTAVCGNSAISATAPVIGARDEDVSFAVAVNTLFGTLAVFLYPLLGHALGLGDAAYGTWAGTAVNDTSQVVAAGFAFSEAAGETATAVKLTRNALMGGVIVLMGFLHAPRGEAAADDGGVPWVRRLRQSLPPFVLGFLALAAVNSLGGLAYLSQLLGVDVAAVLTAAAKLLILVALAGVGLGTRLAALRDTGWRPLAVGLAVATAVSLASLAWIAWFGPAGS